MEQGLLGHIVLCLSYVDGSLSAWNIWHHPSLPRLFGWNDYLQGHLGGTILDKNDAGGLTLAQDHLESSRILTLPKGKFFHHRFKRQLYSSRTVKGPKSPENYFFL